MESAKKKLKVKCILSGILSILLCMACDTGEKMSLTSPDSKVSVNVYLRDFCIKTIICQLDVYGTGGWNH